MFASRKLVESALAEVKKKFVKVVAAKLPYDGPEYDLVQYRCRNLFDNTVIGGKYSRASLCVDATRALQPHLRDETQELKAVCEAAATLEIIQSFYLIADDIMDASETRRGKPCWYRREGVGMSAINDAFIMDSFVEDILRLSLPGHVNLDRLCEAYRRSKQKTLIGQVLDTSSVHQTSSFTWDRYELMVENKTSHYTVYHPLQMALLMSDVLAYHGAVKKVAYQIGFLFQSQDDFLDVYGDPIVTGKIGTDIQDGKCTWLAVRALQKMQNTQSPALYEEFKSVFGSTEPEKVDRVKEIYEQLELSHEFRRFEQHFSEEIKKSVSEIPDVIAPLRTVLDGFVTKLVKRNA
uniref:Farnesyl pyrophosphate synthase n=1 Tax=Caenorhabditis japonica TaxID=281687 RepID=A0A8R1HL75_CAEJA